MDTYADDVAEIVKALDLREALFLFLFAVPTLADALSSQADHGEGVEEYE